MTLTPTSRPAVIELPATRAKQVAYIVGGIVAGFTLLAVILTATLIAFVLVAAPAVLAILGFLIFKLVKRIRGNAAQAGWTNIYPAVHTGADAANGLTVRSSPFVAKLGGYMGWLITGVWGLAPILWVAHALARGFGRVVPPRFDANLRIPVVRTRAFSKAIERTIRVVQGWSNGAWLNDGNDGDFEVLPYDAALKDQAPALASFREVWLSDISIDQFTFVPQLLVAPAGVGGNGNPALPAENIGNIPDPLGVAGLTSAALRRVRIRDLRDLYLSAREIDDMCDPDLDDAPNLGVVRLVQINTVPSLRWIVQISSTQSWNPRSGPAPNDLTADLYASTGLTTQLLRGTRKALSLAGVKKDEPVLATGFSLGGLIAAQLCTESAEFPLTVTHLIVAGSPIGRAKIRPEISVLSFEHLLDPIHRLDGRPRGTVNAPLPRWKTITAGPPMPQKFSLSMTHHAPSYAETALSATPLIEDPASFAPYFGAEQMIFDFAVRRTIGAPDLPGVLTLPRGTAAVPVYFSDHSPEGRARQNVRDALRTLTGVLAADVYLSRTGFPDAKTWTADVIVHDLDTWLSSSYRSFVYWLLRSIDGDASLGYGFRLCSSKNRNVVMSVEFRSPGGSQWFERFDLTGPDAVDFEAVGPPEPLRASGIPHSQAPRTEQSRYHYEILYPRDPVGMDRPTPPAATAPRG